MKVRSFNELADGLKDFGYPEHWVHQGLVEGIEANTSGFTVGGLMSEKGEQFYVNFDFKLSRDGMELKVGSMALLSPGYEPKPGVEREHSAPAEKWVAHKITFGEILPAHFLQRELLAERNLSAGKSAENAGEISVPEEIIITRKNYTMNRNSLENFRVEAAGLKVPQSMINAAESMMEQGIEKFTVQGQIAVDKGMMDVSIHMKKSGQSDYYYLNRFEVAQSKAKPLEKEDHKYLVITEDGDKNLLRKFDSAVQAMDFFRDQKGVSELAVGKPTAKDLEFRETLASMRNGKVDYVQRDFQQAFYAPVLRNAHYIDRGKGFTVEQAANMLQGRAVFRDDMVSRAGEQYKAWSIYQFDKPKDKYGNYTIKQFGEGYDFNLKKELAGYEIKEMAKPELAKLLGERLENGFKPVVTVIGKDGQEKSLRIEAVPRFSNLNFFELSGKPVKREELKKDLDASVDLGKNKSQAKDKSKGQDNEISM